MSVAAPAQNLPPQDQHGQGRRRTPALPAALAALHDLVDQLADTPVWPLDDDELTGAVDTLSAQIARLEAVRLTLVREVDGRDLAGRQTDCPWTSAAPAAPSRHICAGPWPPGTCAAPSRAATGRQAGARYHIHPWQHGGPTALHNLVLLCRRHHTTAGACASPRRPARVHPTSPDRPPPPAPAQPPQPHRRPAPHPGAPARRAAPQRRG